jgi:arylsulfatase
MTKLLQGDDARGKSFKVHIDGYDDLLAGKGQGPRYNRWKAVFMEQRTEALDVWHEPLVALRVPLLFDLR